MLGIQAARGIGVVLKRSDAADAFAKIESGRAVSRANVENMVAQPRSGKQPGEYVALGKIAPERRGTNEMF